jgi:hypothetical protein
MRALATCRVLDPPIRAHGRRDHLRRVVAAAGLPMPSSAGLESVRLNI